MKKLLIIPAILIVSVAMGQSKAKVYHIKKADTVNIYNNKTVISIKQTNGGWKYITVHPKDRWIVDSANVVNQY